MRRNLVIKEEKNVDSVGLEMRLWDCLKPEEINLWFCKQALSGKCCLLEPAPPATINALRLGVSEGCISGKYYYGLLSVEETYKILHVQLV